VLELLQWEGMGCGGRLIIPIDEVNLMGVNKKISPIFVTIIQIDHFVVVSFSISHSFSVCYVLIVLT
jgi:hypothetical protein